MRSFAHTPQSHAAASAATCSAPTIGANWKTKAPKRAPSTQTTRVLDYLGAVRAAAAFIRGGL